VDEISTVVVEKEVKIRLNFAFPPKSTCSENLLAAINAEAPLPRVLLDASLGTLHATFPLEDDAHEGKIYTV